jgi:hypothetical protein
LKFILLFIVFSFQLTAQSARVLKKVNKLIEKTYNVDNSELKNLNFTSTSAAGYLYGIQRAEVLLGYAFLGTAPSKTDTFEYLVLFDPDLIIKKVNVLVYREDYGGEIGSNRWLKQFIGIPKNTNLIVGKNVAAISGATISVYSMTNAINQLLIDLIKVRQI